MHFRMWIKLLFGRVDLLPQDVNDFPGRFGGFQFSFYFVNPVHNGGVIPSTQILTYDLQSRVRHMTAEIHDDLSGECDLAVSSVSYNISRSQIKMISNDICD